MEKRVRLEDLKPSFGYLNGCSKKECEFSLAFYAQVSYHFRCSKEEGFLDISVASDCCSKIHKILF